MSVFQPHTVEFGSYQTLRSASGYPIPYPIFFVSNISCDHDQKFGLQMSFPMDIISIGFCKVVSVHFLAMNARHLYMVGERRGFQGLEPPQKLNLCQCIHLYVRIAVKPLVWVTVNNYIMEKSSQYFSN